MSDTMNETNTPPEVPQIGVVELHNAVLIIDAAAERGAFKGDELSKVGATRDCLAAFVAAVAPLQKQDDDANKDNEKSDKNGSA